MNAYAWIEDELASLAERDLLRDLPATADRQSTLVEAGGGKLVNFASNDYLGLATDSRLIAAAINACQATGVGRGSSPLICGRSTVHEQLEQRLAEFEGVEAALLFPSGFAANAGIIPALVERGDAIFADAANHASLIDGCRLSRADVHVYSHGDANVLESLLKRHGQSRRRLIVTDTLFSMDGDVAPLVDIADLAQRHGAMVLLDEAHATGVFGGRGRGVAEACGLPVDAAVRIGTLSKALGAAGGFVSGSRSLVQWLANRARSYVFSTAQPAAAAAAATAALDIVANEPERRIRLLDSAAELRGQLAGQGWNVGRSTSQIIPLVVGEPAAALALSQALRKRGYWVPAIRPPSVAPGQSLLRLSLTAGHTAPMIQGLLDALDELISRGTPGAEFVQ